MKYKLRFGCFLAVLLLFASLAQASGSNPTNGPDDNATKVDDWQFDYDKLVEDMVMPSMPLGSKTLAVRPMSSAAAPMPKKLGLSAGGAKDANNFRENIKNNYLPLPTDITYEGLFYDYHFDTGPSSDCTKLFCPKYSLALSPDPFSGKDELFLSVGLESGMKESDFKRKRLNLVVVLDISGSMGSRFNRYYYDRFGMKHKNEDNAESRGRTKMAIANRAVVELTRHLHDDDNFAMVLFDDESYIAKPFRRVGNTDMESIRGHILEIRDHGGTNMYSGMKAGIRLLDKLKDKDPAVYENRVIFLTDAMPNRGVTSKRSMFTLASDAARRNIHTTFIGVGVDFNTDLVEGITKIRGANYYSVHSEKKFTKRMGEEFDYMVTPLVFDLNLRVQGKGYAIDSVYGSPEADLTTGRVMKVNTLFPSATDDTGTKGGIILVKLRRTGEAADDNIKLTASWEDRSGNPDSMAVDIKATGLKPGEYADTGIRKGIALVRYGELMKSWLVMQRMQKRSYLPISCKPLTRFAETGIVSPRRCIDFGGWERQSMPLKVGPGYARALGLFSGWFAKEISAVGDKSMGQELDILRRLVNPSN